MRFPSACALWLGVWLTMLPAGVCLAQPGQSGSGGGASAPAGAEAVLPDPVPAELVQELRTAIEDAERLEDVEESERTAVMFRLRELLDTHQTVNDRLNDLQQAAQSAPQLRDAAEQRLRRDLASVRARFEAAPDASIAQLQQLVDAARAQLDAVLQELAQLESEEQRRTDRLVRIPEELARLRADLEALRADAAGGVEEGATPALEGVRQLANRFEIQLLPRRIARRELEQQVFREQTDLLTLRQRATARYRDQLREVLGDLETRLNRERLESAEERWRLAQAAVRKAKEADRPAVLIRALETNAELASLRVRREDPDTEEISAGLVDRAAAVSELLRERTADLEAIAAQYARTRERVVAAAGSETMGRLLQLRRDELAAIDQRAIERRIASLQRELGETLGETIRLQDELGELRDVSAYAEAILRTSNLTPSQRDELQAELEAILEVRLELLQSLVSEYERLTGALGSGTAGLLISLEQAEREYLRMVRRFKGFLDERVLWVRSGDPIAVRDWRAVRDTALWAGDPDAWLRWARGTPRVLVERWSGLALALLLPVLMFSLQGWARGKLALIAQQTKRVQSDSFLLTMRALLLTLLLSGRVPVLFASVAWLLAATADGAAQVGPAGSDAAEGVTQAAALAQGFASAALLVWLLSLLGEVLRDGGLGQAHLRWSERSRLSVSRNLRWLAWSIVPMAVIAAALASPGEVSITADALTVARLIFVVGLGVITAFWAVLLRPNGPMMMRLFADSDGWLPRLRWVWYGLAVSLPLAVMLLAASGYSYTANQLQMRLQVTVWLIVALLLTRGLAERWLFVTRRRLAMEQARRRREAMSTSQDSGKTDSSESGGMVASAQVDLQEMNERTRGLFRSLLFLSGVLGAWFIWASVLPALGQLDRAIVVPELRWVGTQEYEQALLEAERQGETIERAIVSPDVSEDAEAGTPSLPPMLTPQSGGNAEAAAAQADPPVVVTAADILRALVLLFITITAARNLPGLMELVLLERLPLDYGARYAISTVSRYLILIIGVVLTFNALEIGWGRLQWLVAALTFGLAFGLQEIFANFVSGLILLTERPIRVGDIVTVNGTTGKVSRIRMRATTITDWDRKELVIPNKSFVTGDLINWTLTDPILRVIVKVGVAYGSDVPLVTRLIRDAAERQEEVLKEPPPSVLFLSFGDSSLNFELRCFIPTVDVVLKVQDGLHRSIERSFREHGVVIPFPQRDVHVYPELEGSGGEPLSRTVVNAAALGGAD